MVDLVNELAGKVAIVTGSARNIGRAVALELSRAGAALVINARESMDLCEEVAAEIVSTGGQAIPFVADINDAEAVERMVGSTVSEFGGIDILINNAAIRSRKPFIDLNTETWAEAMSAAFQGSFQVTRACVPHIVDRGGGSIIGVGGLNSYRGQPERVHGMASKAGLAGLIRGLAFDLGKYGIRSNFVVVGSFDTDLTGSSSSKTEKPKATGIPLGRLGVPQDMADLVRFLVGPGASYISGQTIHLNGAEYCPF